MISYDECEVPDIQLSARERQLRDRFVDEYLKDFDALDACIRVGYLYEFAKAYAIKFMQEPYVLQQIQLKRRMNAVNQDELDKQLVMSSLRESCVKGPMMSRVVASGKMAELLGMREEAKQKANRNNGSVGVMVVPMAESLEQWEDFATKQQEKLIDDSKSE